jgi:serine/threonine protein phosphatase 1
VTIYAVGDIHGMADLLRDRLAAVRRHADKLGIPNPKTVFLGDYVDRGPDTKGVLDLLSGQIPGEGPEALGLDPVFLLGNHDLALLNILRGADASASWMEDEGGWRTMASYGDFRARRPSLSIKRFRAAVPEAHRRFLGDLEVSWRCGGLFFSHAGIGPDTPLESQPFAALVYGDPHLFRHDHPHLAPTLRERLGAVCVHGHWNERQVALWPHRVGIDTGAGYAAGRLTVVALENDAVEVLP